MQANVIPTSLTFGSALDDFFNNVQNIKSTVIEGVAAATEIELLIENTKEVYKADLKCTTDKLNTKVKETFNQISQLIEELKTVELDKIDSLKTRAQQLLKTLPFASTQSQFTGIKPNGLSSINDVAKSSLIVLQGKFPSSMIKGFEPSLTFADKKCTLLNSTPDSLTFEVPNSVLVNDGTDQNARVMGTLSAPWNNGYLRYSKAEANYRVSLRVLQDSSEGTPLAVEDMPESVKADLAELQKLTDRLQKLAHLSNLPSEIRLHIKEQPTPNVSLANDNSENSTNAESSATIESSDSSTPTNTIMTNDNSENSTNVESSATVELSDSLTPVVNDNTSINT